mmetsp:Transcript_2000/g.4562  ORF Transcript_2000/g.4562 Transcript_2000/m.4562 type:complete len:212 (-) Transcript_2000:1087-1722(-)
MAEGSRVAGDVSPIENPLHQHEHHASPPASQNVSEDGNFSIQVLSAALQVYDLAITPFAMTTPLENQPTQPIDFQCEDAFILNLRHHWYAFRKVGGRWFDLNSLHAAPSEVSPFFLGAFLSQVEVDRDPSTLFVVRGSFPTGTGASVTLASSSSQHSGKWWTAGEIDAFAAMQKASRTSDSAAAAAAAIDDAELQAAIKASLGELNNNNNN